MATKNTVVTLPGLPRGISVRVLGGGRYSFRWRDPVTRDAKGEPLQVEKRFKFSSDTKAAEHARKQHALNQAARTRRTDQESAARTLGVPLAPAKPLSKRTIEAESADYFVALARPELRPQATLRHAEETLFMFLAWCSARGITLLEDLTAEHLSSYWDHLHALRTHSGKSYKMSTVNQFLKYPRAMLRRAAAKGRYHLNYDTIRENLKHTSTKDKTLYGISTSRALEPQEIKALLLAALKYDARDRTRDRVTTFGLQRDRPIAPDVAMLLLSGMRRGEYTRATCSMARYEPNERAMVLELPSPIVKRFRRRAVFYRGVSPLGSSLLLALVQDREPSEWLSMYTFSQLANVLKTLHRSYGAPKCSAHDIRATCATYQLSVAGLDLYRACERLGHTPQIAHESYLRRVTGQPFGAKTLEAAMLCEREFKLVLKATQSAAPGIRRAEHRTLYAPYVTRALSARTPDGALSIETARDAISKWKTERARKTEHARARREKRGKDAATRQSRHG